MTGLRWSRRTTSTIAEELAKLGIAVSPNTVARLLHDMGYSLRVNHKQISTNSSPHRNLQFEYLAELRDRFQRRHLPIVSVDSKKRELVGNFKNPGRLPRVASMITTSAPIPSGSPSPMEFMMFWKIAALWWSAFPTIPPPLPLMPSPIGGTRKVLPAIVVPANCSFLLTPAAATVAAVIPGKPNSSPN